MPRSKTKIPARGGCHCGAVEYEVMVSRRLLVHKCNCSICSKSGYIHLIVPAKDFRLLRGEAQLSEYCFNTGIAKHLFCSQCGIKSFYVPRSHPDDFSVNVNCLELPGEFEITVEKFDGLNWELQVGALVKLCKEN